MAKIIFASAASVIIGIYALSLATADEASYAVAKAQALRTQTMQIAMAGVKFATVDLGKKQNILPSGTVSLMGGSVYYKTEIITQDMYGYESIKATATGTYPLADTSVSGRHHITYVAKLEFKMTHWATTSISLAPDKNEYAKLN